MVNPYLTMQGITKRFPGVTALQDVSFQAYPGEAMALIGANGAGKSTLMNVLGGVIRADSGEIQIDGARVEIDSPLSATANGIAFVHQEMAMLPTMTVAENLHISQFPTRGGLINTSETDRRSAEVLRRMGCQFTPDTRVQFLSTGDRQMVEIARALLTHPRIVIFDEPTSSLTSREKARLFEVIRSLKTEGVTIIYITHFLDEVFQICERATVLRGGETVGSGMLKDLTPNAIVQMMIGDIGIEVHRKRETAATAEPILGVSSLSRKGALRDVSFTLHKGEVLGLWGLLGSGRTEVARAVIGLDPIDSGQVEVRTDGAGMRPIKPGQAQRWIGMITEDRRSEGLLLSMSVKNNMSLANLRGLANRWLLVRGDEETRQAQEFVDRLNIIISSLRQPVGTLSGGNQQKVVVGRWLQVSPPIIIMDEPTRGLDVGAKAEIRNIILELAEAGKGVLVISSELEEMMALCHRYLVMNRGQIVRELPGTASRNELMAAAAGVDFMEDR
ncbi:MAG: sugar ABC transporter ATP-binding protein [Anaerolineae bacterium]|nr:sugar ABC transporter ATP-binding protein [Anaerolineae bacterium]